MVGHDLEVACRFFDKGNSLAVKELKQYADTQFGCAVSEDDRRAFARRVKETVIPALESDLGREDLVFLGPEAAFAPVFAERFGRSTRQALAAFHDEVERLLGGPAETGRFAENAAARSLGTQYPFIQGAMTWISDSPDFALAVSEAGGLPTIGLGLKSRVELEQDLDRLREIMGERPYAVNFIALPENPHLEAQLAWIEQPARPWRSLRPENPSMPRDCRKRESRRSISPPTKDLIRMALKAGVRFVVLEGNEAGGHVGEHSTLTLAQIALELKRREPELFRDRYLVLAGGIFNRETAFRALMLGRRRRPDGHGLPGHPGDRLHGCLEPLVSTSGRRFRPGTTEVSGESVGLRVRSLKTPTMDAICTLEREWPPAGTTRPPFASASKP